MAIATWADFDIKVHSPHETLYTSKIASLAEPIQKWSSEWLASPLPGVAPTTAEAPTRATAGALGQQNGTGLRIVGMQVGHGVSGPIALCDRLSHQGGLVGNLNTEQTTNLPTAALTRYTDGVGVIMALEIYSNIGTTATSFTVSYTNEAGTAGQISQVMPIGGTSWREARRNIWLPLAVGDKGVRSVESVTLAATTGTAGNFGVTLFKPLVMIPMPGRQARRPDPILGDLMGGLPEILTDACLYWLWMPAQSAVVEAGTVAASIAFAED